MPNKESGAQGRKRRARFEAFLNKSKKFMKKYFTNSGSAKRQSANIRRQDESADADSQRILKHRGRKFFVCPGAQDVGNSNSIFLLPFVIIWFKNCRSAASGSLNVLKLFVC